MMAKTLAKGLVITAAKRRQRERAEKKAKRVILADMKKSFKAFKRQRRAAQKKSAKFTKKVSKYMTPVHDAKIKREAEEAKKWLS